MEVLEHDGQANEILIHSDDMPLDAWRAYGYDDAPEVEIKIAYDSDYNDQDIIILGAWDGETELFLTYQDKDLLRCNIKDYLQAEKDATMEFFLGE